MVARRLHRILAEPVEPAAPARATHLRLIRCHGISNSIRPRSGFPQPEDPSLNLVRCR